LRQIPTIVVRYPAAALDYGAHEDLVRARLPRAGSFVVRAFLEEVDRA
jgi:hypothetical protein